jgi:hypothetical protein
MWIAITATASTVSWQTASIVLAALVVPGVLRLLAEWQRRQTIRVLMARVPEGTVVTLSDTPAGQSMKASLGTGPSRRQNAGS